MAADIALPLRVRLFRRRLLGCRPAFVGSFLKHLLRINRLVIQTDDGAFFVDPLSHLGNSLVHGAYEPRMAQLIRQHLHVGETFVDVGANEGYFSILAGQVVGPTGKVLSIEPQQRLHPVINRNADLNNLDNISVTGAAVSDAESTSILHLSPDMNTGSSGLHRTTRYKLRTQQVQTKRLASVLDEATVTEVALMKMDIEGFEYEAILGSPEVFRSHRVRRLALELHPNQLQQRGKSSDDILKFLGDCGYAVTNVAGIQLFTAVHQG